MQLLAHRLSIYGCTSSFAAECALDGEIDGEYAWANTVFRFVCLIGRSIKWKGVVAVRDPHLHIRSHGNSRHAQRYNVALSYLHASSFPYGSVNVFNMLSAFDLMFVVVSFTVVLVIGTVG
jgi:hypothetical protein